MIQTILAAFLSLYTIVAPIHNYRTVLPDWGGSLSTYLKRFTYVRESGGTFTVDGVCVSACTIGIGVLPPDQICYTPRAMFGFHSAWVQGLYGPMFSKAGTDLIWKMYPEKLREVLRKHGWDGGEHPDLIILTGDELEGAVRPCST